MRDLLGFYKRLRNVLGTSRAEPFSVMGLDVRRGQDTYDRHPCGNCSLHS
jgi:hypothetical protein